MRVMLTPWIAPAGFGVGVVFGLFGAGGSAVATPVLALLGVPGIVAVASPLPAVLPASIVGARRYIRSGNLDARTARLAIEGGLPGTVAGALVSGALGGHKLLLLSGVLLLVLGARIVLPDRRRSAARAAARRDNTGLIVGASFVIGVLTGLLANSGGFLLVPLFMLVLGLSARRAAGTSLVAVGVLIVPTLVTHWALGHIDWSVALLFAVGAIPGSVIGSAAAQHLPMGVARRLFGLFLVGFALLFLAVQ